jgi:hypothetical protein
MISSKFLKNREKKGIWSYLSGRMAWLLQLRKVASYFDKPNNQGFLSYLMAEFTKQVVGVCLSIRNT